MRRLATFALLALAPGLLGGCAALFSSYDVAPSGLTRNDDALRRQLAEGRFDSALDRVAPGSKRAPGDDLLLLLYQGIIAHYAGRYAESSAALDLAYYVAEDRFTRSASRELLSLVTSDRVLPYTAERTERLMIHYYNALNHLRLGDPRGAAVEARRLGFLLQLYEDRDGSETYRRHDAVLRYVAGVAFEAAGEWNDADVAYRNARRLNGGELPEAIEVSVGSASPAARGENRVSSSADGGVPGRGHDGHAHANPATGEVVVFLERGYVAHRVGQSFNLLLLPDEADVFVGGTADARAAMANAVAARLLANSATAGGVGPVGRAGPGAGAEAAGTAGPAGAPGVAGSAPAGLLVGSRGGDGSPYVLRVAWPTLRSGWRASAPPRVIVGTAGQTAPAQMLASVSDAVVADFEGERAEILTRAILRAAAKFAASRGAARAAASLAGRGGDKPRDATSDGEPARTDERPRDGAGDPPRDAAGARTPGQDGDTSRAAAPDTTTARTGGRATGGPDAGRTAAAGADRRAGRNADETADTAAGADRPRRDAERAAAVGEVVGFLANLGGAVLEQADTRSWHLLPAEIGVVRLRLPPGTHEITLQVPGGIGQAARSVSLGSVDVRPGGITVLSARVF